MYLASSAECMAILSSIASRAALVCLAATWLPAVAAEPVRATLADGRIASGLVDSRTDSQQLWLRAEHTSIRLSSAFAWEDVVSVSQHGVVLEKAALIERRVQNGGPALPTAVLPLPQAFPREDFRLQSAIMPRTKVGRIEIHAELGRWDAYVPASGLVVTVEVFDERGAPIDVLGEIELTLCGEAAPLGRNPPEPVTLQELAAAHQRVHPADFVGGQATYRLPFDRRHPDFDPSVSPFGLVQARLGVNGQGVFEASDSFVRLRPFGPTRDACCSTRAAGDCSALNRRRAADASKATLTVTFCGVIWPDALPCGDLSPRAESPLPLGCAVRISCAGYCAFRSDAGARQGSSDGQAWLFLQCRQAVHRRVPMGNRRVRGGRSRWCLARQRAAAAERGIGRDGWDGRRRERRLNCWERL